MFRNTYPDLLSPVMRSSPALAVSPEQFALMEKILDVHCSDVKSKQKALIGITYVLTNGNTLIPAITSIAPSSVVSGSSFTLTVNGSGFLNNGRSVIIVNGNEVPTTFVSPSQLTAFITAPLTAVTRTFPVMVQNPTVMSLPVNITVTP